MAESLGGNSQEALRGFIERVERLNDEIKDLGADRTAVFAEAKSAGFDPKIMRQAIRRRAMDAAAREEQDELLALYEGTLASIL